MGEHFPHFPQEHYCDPPEAPFTGRRANVVAGLTGAEAILTGLAGVRPQPDGSLLIDPHPPTIGTVELQGLFRGRRIDVSLSPGACRIAVDGHQVHEGDPHPVLAIPAPPDGR